MRRDTTNRIGAFISIPKNASKTVLDVLELGRNRDSEITNSLVIYENHQRGMVLDARYNLGPLYVFCFCRNPYDRCVSWFEYHKEMEPYRTLSFETWIKNGMPHHWVQQNQTNYITEGISPLLQYHYVEQCKIDFVGRMENFEQDFSSIIEKLNELCTHKGLLHRFSYRNEQLNTSTRHAAMDSYYTPETRKIVYELLEKDFTYFGYER